MTTVTAALISTCLIADVICILNPTTYSHSFAKAWSFTATNYFWILHTQARPSKN